MTPDTTRKVYLENPDIYEADLHNIVQVMDEIKLALGRCEEVYLQDATLVLWNAGGYPIGTLQWQEDFWKFTPHNESYVEADVDVV